MNYEKATMEVLKAWVQKREAAKRFIDDLKVFDNLSSAEFSGMVSLSDTREKGKTVRAYIPFEERAGFLIYLSAIYQTEYAKYTHYIEQYNKAHNEKKEHTSK